MTSKPSSGPAPATGCPSGLDERTTWRAYVVAVSVASLTILDLAKINVAIPSISESLGAGPTEIQLLVAGFVLAFGLLLVPSGRMGDLYSRKGMFLTGLALFTLASLACALAPTIEILIAGRIAQGFAAGVLMPQVLGLVQQLFQGPARGRAFGIFGAVIGLSTAFGPTLGGILVGIGGEALRWHLLFWMNVPLGMAAFVLAYRLLPRSTGSSQQAVKHFDLIGTALLGVTVFTLMLPFVLTTGTEADDANRWWLLVAAVVAGGLFVAWEARYARSGKVGIIDFALFRIPSFRNGVAVSSSYFAALPSTFIVLTLWLQQGLGFSPVVAGMVTIPFALLSALSSWRSGLVVNTLGRRLVIGGLLMVLVGFGGVITVSQLVPSSLMPWAVAGMMAIAGLGGGAVISPNQTLMLEDVPVHNGGLAGSIAQVGQRIGTAMGLAAVLSVFFGLVSARPADEPATYLTGFTVGIGVSVGFLTVSLVFAVLDLRRRRSSVENSAPLD